MQFIAFVKEQHFAGKDGGLRVGADAIGQCRQPIRFGFGVAVEQDDIVATCSVGSRVTADGKSLVGAILENAQIEIAQIIFLL